MEDSVQLVLAANTGAGLSTSEIRNLILDSSLKCSLISPKLVSFLLYLRQERTIVNKVVLF